MEDAAANKLNGAIDAMIEEAKPIPQSTGGAVESAGGMQADRPGDRENPARAEEAGLHEYIRDLYRSLTDLGAEADKTVDGRFVADQPTQNGPPAVKVTRSGTSERLSPATRNYKHMAIGSLVCGVLSLTIIVGFILGPVAIVFGVVARKGMRDSNNRDGYEMAAAGIITGAIGAVLALAYFVLGGGS